MPSDAPFAKRPSKGSHGLILDLLARDREVVSPEKRELVPVAPLELNLAIVDLEEPAASKSERVTPFQNRPVAVLEDVLHNAHHFGALELGLEHPSDLVAPLHR